MSKSQDLDFFEGCTRSISLSTLALKPNEFIKCNSSIWALDSGSSGFLTSTNLPIVIFLSTTDRAKRNKSGTPDFPLWASEICLSIICCSLLVELIKIIACKVSALGNVRKPLLLSMFLLFSSTCCISSCDNFEIDLASAPKAKAIARQKVELNLLPENT